MKVPFLLLLWLISVTSLFIYSLSSLSAHSNLVIVQMSKDGFEPNEVTIDENQTVLFVNKDEIARWPASNVHPTHELYPEFDPKKPIEPTKSWSFKPKKVGTWKYHDHLNPHFRGTLIVKAENGAVSADADNSKLSFLTRIKNYINTLVEKLKSTFQISTSEPVTPETFRALDAEKQSSTLKEIAKGQGGQKAWETVSKSFETEAGSSGNVHDLAHLAGSLIFESDGLDGISMCTASFAFGCYHGLLDSAFAKNLDNLDQAEKACLSVGAANSGPNASCVHGIGHGIASFYNGVDLKSSLSSCKKLNQGQTFCYDGVLMEFVRSAPSNFYKADDPLYPCSELEKEHVSACGRNQPRVMMDRFKFNIDQVIKICQTSSSSDLKQACFDSIGFIAAESNDSESIVKTCKSIGSPFYVASCTKSASGELIFQNAPGWQEKSKEICNSLSGNYKNECLEYIQKIQIDYQRR